MSLKDKIVNKIGIKNYEFGRGIIQGTFAVATFGENLEKQKFRSAAYIFGAPFGVASLLMSISCVPMLFSSGNYLPHHLTETSCILLATNSLSVVYELHRYKKQQKTEQTLPQPKEPTNIDPWCELKEPEQKPIDPWCKLESVIQNV